MRPYKPFYEAWNDYLPPVSQIAGKDDISKWSDEKAKQEISRLKSFISRIRTTGDDQSVQQEVRASYDAINRIEAIKWPDKYAKKQASKDRARDKAFDKRKKERNLKISSDAQKFASASDKEQAIYVLSGLERAIRYQREAGRRARPEHKKMYKREERELTELKNRVRELYPNLEGRNNFRNLERDDDLIVSSLIKDRKLKSIQVDYEKWHKRRYGV